MKIKLLLLASSVALILSSCGSSKDIPYMIDAKNLSSEALKNAPQVSDPVLMTGDMLQINVAGADEESVKPFNKTQYVSQTSSSSSLNNGDNSMFYYLVDTKGEIEFPMVGKVKVGGLTKSAVEDIIAQAIYPRYLNQTPGVEVRIMNFRVYALGEVGSPGIIRSSNGQLNILEAISMAGDLTIHGRRDNIMIIRTAADGSRQVKTVNLNDPNIIVSNDFYLQQNDCIYVEPNSSKARSSWQVPPGLSLGTGLLGTAISIATFVITLTRK